MNNAEIIICTEQGYLESNSKLLVSTIREFGGKYKDIPIVSYQPRKSKRISKDTIKFFEQNNVEYIDIELNIKYPNYPLANKPLICAHRESTSSAEILIFLDSDVFIYNEPKELFEFQDGDVILRPVDSKNIGTNNESDKNLLYWNKLYQILGINNRRFVTTTVTNDRILEYYNSGHISTLTKNQLFNRWLENFNKVMKKGFKPVIPFFIEQSTFSATVSQMELNVRHLSKGYNYPLHKAESIKNPNYSLSDTDQIVSAHYHSIFKSQIFYHSFVNNLLKTEKGKRIRELIKEHGVIQQYSFFVIPKTLLLNQIKRKYNKLKKYVPIQAKKEKTR